MSVLCFAVVGRAAVVGTEHHVAGARVHLRPVAAVEAEHVGRGRPAVNGDDERVALAGLVADRLDEHAAHLRAVGRRPRDFFLLAEREVAHLRIGIRQLHPGRAVRDRFEGRHREHRRRRRAVGVVDQNAPAVVVAAHRDGRLLLRDLPHFVLVHVDGEELVGRPDAFVEVDRVAVVRPEAEADVAVEPAFELAERRATVGHGADVDAAVRHAVAGQVVGRREGHPASVGREAQAAFADFEVVREALDLARGHLEQVQVRVETFLRDVALVPVRRRPAEPDPLAVVAHREARDGVGALLAEASCVGDRVMLGHLRGVVGAGVRHRLGAHRRACRQVHGPEARRRRLGVADVDGEALLAPRLLVLVESIGRDEVHARAVRRERPVVDAGRLFRQLLGRRVRVLDGQPEDLTAFIAAGTIDEPVPVVAHDEVANAVFGIGHAPRFTAIGAHRVDLVLTRGVCRRFAVRQEEERLPVGRPRGRGLVLLRRERHLLRRRHALGHRHEVEVRLPFGLLPVGRRDGVEHPRAVRARRGGAGVAQLLHVEECHCALRGRLCGHRSSQGQTERRGNERGKREKTRDAAS